MLERFTEKSQAVMVQAQDEARSLGHNFVGTEQILLGIMADGENEAASALSNLAVNLEDARQAVKQIIGLGSGFTDAQIPFTPRVKRVLDLALEEAKKLGDENIEPKHLLLGIMREGAGVAAVVVKKLATPSDDIIQSLYQSFEEAA
ncbi:MAG: Clp protease N-terminal domain-containing protein [Cyanobacteria bacterium P01_D01_bin.44]